MITLTHYFGRLLEFIARRTRLRKMVAGNIKKVLPEVNAEQAADRLIENTAYAIFEIALVPFLRKKHLASIIKWENREKLERALQAGKGVMLISMHLGNYELVPMALAHLGYPVTTIIRATKDPIFRIVNFSRRSGGVKLINILEDDMFRGSLKALKDNELICIVADTGALESRHSRIEFLGREVPVATGWLTLAERAECMVLPILIKKEGRTNTFTFTEPLKITRDNREEIIHKIAGMYGEFIRKNPEQWLMFLNPHETQRMIEGK